MAAIPHEDPGPDPTWEDAVASAGSGEPVELIRPSRKVTVHYRYADERVHATSPDLLGFEVTGSTLSETKRLVRADLARYIESGVELLEREPRRMPDTEGASRTWRPHGPGQLVTTTTGGRSAIMSAMSPARARWK